MTSKYKSVRAVVFDAVGTLIYPNPPAPVVYFNLGRQHGSSLSQNEIATNFGHALKQQPYTPETNEPIERDRWRRIVAAVFNDLTDTEALFEQLWSHFARATSWSVYEDVSDVLRELNKRGFITAIGSNFDARLLVIANELAALHQVHEIFVSSKVGFTKPSLKFFKAIEARFRLTPNQLLMVGDDTTNDLEGASNAGWYSLLLDRMKTSYILDRVTSLTALDQLLLKLKTEA